MNQNQIDANFRKINNCISNPTISLPRYTKDDNLKRFFPNASRSNRSLTNINDNTNFQTEGNVYMKIAHESQIAGTRGFGKDLTNFYNGYNTNNIPQANITKVLHKAPSLSNLNNNGNILNFIKPIKKREESKPKNNIKNEISLYNLRPRGNLSNFNSKNNSANNSFSERGSSKNLNNENVNILSVNNENKKEDKNKNFLNQKKLNSSVSLNDNNEMDVEMNQENYSNNMNLEEKENLALEKQEDMTISISDTNSNILSQNSQKETFTSSVSQKSENSLNNLNYNNNNLFSLFNNPQKVADYIDDIYFHLRSSEKLFSPQISYMKNQRDINEKMRGILIDWLVDVHLRFKLVPETLFLTTTLIDRYLEKVEINRNKLQLIGVTSLFIASKYEEIYPPELKDFVDITDKAYSKEDILKTEYEILRTLDFNITTPSSLRLLEVYLELLQIKLDNQQLFFAKYLLELFLVDYRMIKYPSSWIAASTIYITMKVKKFNIIDGTRSIDMPKITGYTDEKIKECAKDICIVLDNSERSSLQAVRNKYSSTKFLEVAKWKKN